MPNLTRNKKILPFRRKGETDEEWMERFKDVREGIARDYQHIDFNNPFSFGEYEKSVMAKDLGVQSNA